MAIVFYYGSGSPFAWRVWLALEHKKLPYEFRLMSFDKGDLKQPSFQALTPRGKVPLIQDGDYVLYESSAIVEYLQDAYPTQGSALFPADPKARGVARRLIREAEEYLVESLDGLLEQVLFVKPEKWSDEAIAAAKDKFLAELPHWQRAATGKDFLAGAAGAADFAAYPYFALSMRAQKRRASLALDTAFGPQLNAWMRRVEALPYFEKTIPPHWRT
ncbi:MAG: glutathione S-transferase family protein [Burkholderiaceae bacterium]|nr:glutathione S-transferase family protein [Burkholderiaceae bacterium]